MRKVLISGGAGFIGHHLAKKLCELKYEVKILDNFSPQVHGKDYNYELLSGMEIIKDDIRKKKAWEKALKDVDIVFHFAAETGTGQSMYQIKKYNEVNVIGTSNFLEVLAKRKTNIRKVILSSSRAVYGEGKYLCRKHGVVYPKNRHEMYLSKGDFSMKCPICLEKVSELPTDENSFTNPVSIYGITKLAQEQLLLNICNALELPAVALRYQNVYGPGQSLKNPYTGILSIFSNRFINNKPVYIFEDGKESRDFVFIDDVVRANIAAMEIEEANGQIINVGTGKKITVLTVAKTLKRLYGSKSDIIITGEYRIGDIRHNYADTKKMKKILKLRPTTFFREGAKNFAKWVLDQSVPEDLYEKSLNELKRKGLLK